MCRAMIARALSRSRRAGRGDGRQQPTRDAVPLGVRSARRHHELRARPADLLRVAGARNRRRGRGRRRLRRHPRRSCSPPNAASARGSTASRSASRRPLKSRALLVTGFPVRRAREAGAIPPHVRRVPVAGPARCAGSDRRRSISATSPPAGWTASGKQTQAVGHAGRRADCPGSRRPRDRNGRPAVEQFKRPHPRVERFIASGDARDPGCVTLNRVHGETQKSPKNMKNTNGKTQAIFPVAFPS